MHFVGPLHNVAWPALFLNSLGIWRVYEPNFLLVSQSEVFFYYRLHYEILRRAVTSTLSLKESSSVWQTSYSLSNFPKGLRRAFYLENTFQSARAGIDDSHLGSQFHIRGLIIAIDWAITGAGACSRWLWLRGSLWASSQEKGTSALVSGCLWNEWWGWCRAADETCDRDKAALSKDIQPGQPGCQSQA